MKSKISYKKLLISNHFYIIGLVSIACHNGNGRYGMVSADAKLSPASFDPFDSIVENIDSLSDLSDHNEVLESLISNTDINHKDSNLNTFIHRTISFCYSRQEMAMDKVIAFIDYLIRHGAQPSLKIENRDGHTPIMLALRGRNANNCAIQEDLVNYLLQYEEAKHYPVGQRKNTPLHAAIAKGNEKIVRACLMKGIDPNVINNQGQTPLNLLFSDVLNDIRNIIGNDRVKGLAQCLLDYKADPNIKDDKGDTPLHNAAWEVDHLPIFESLFTSGAKLDETDNNANTALHLILRRCITTGNLTKDDETLECIAFLAKNGNLYQCNICNETAWDLAKKLEAEGVEDVLAVFEILKPKRKKENMSSAKLGKRHMVDITAHMQPFGLNQSKGVLSTKRKPYNPYNLIDYGFSPLPNIGNTCFINSSLQIIAAIYSKETKSLLKEIIDKINSNVPISNQDMGSFIVNLSTIAYKAARSEIEQKNINNFFLDGNQQDPCEFFNRIIDTNMLALPDCQKIERLICKDHNGICWYKEQEVADRSSLWSISVPKGISLSDAINREHSEQITQISRELKKDFNNYKALEQRRLSQSERTKITRLRRFILQELENTPTTDCIKQTIINKLPAKLGIHVRRSKYINVDLSNKIQDEIESVTKVSIQADPNEDNPHIFDLSGFVRHKGGAANNGHYLAYVKREKQWYKVNDSNFTGIKPITDEYANLKAREAYLLFYEEGSDIPHKNTSKINK